MKLDKCKIGMSVKLRNNLEHITKWYTKEIFTIVGFTKNEEKETILEIDKKLPYDFFDNAIELKVGVDSIHPCYVVRDNECIMRDRKLKLNKLGK